MNMYFFIQCVPNSNASFERAIFDTSMYPCILYIIFLNYVVWNRKSKIASSKHESPQKPARCVCWSLVSSYIYIFRKYFIYIYIHICTNF